MPNRLLFICSRNKLRSPTAEAVFCEVPGIEADSAGLSPDAEVHLSEEQIEWADVVFVMESVHRARLNRDFGHALKSKRVVVLGIPDDYEFMDPDLVKKLKRACAPYLR